MKDTLNPKAIAKAIARDTQCKRINRIELLQVFPERESVIRGPLPVIDFSRSEPDNLAGASRSLSLSSISHQK
jgi:hypothetical protein